MATEEVNQNGTRTANGAARWLTGARGRALVLVVAAACALIVLVLPRAVAPTEMPALTLDPAAIAAVLAADRKAADHAPVDGPGARLRDLYYQVGLAETGPGEDPGAAHRRTFAVGQALLSLRRAPNAERKLAALRAQATEAMPGALSGNGSTQWRRELLGGFPEMLERYGLTRDGERIAPLFIVRTLFKARWNAANRVPLTDGFAPVELQAYWGWLAFRGHKIDPQRRLRALDAFAKAGGSHVDEARGVLAYKAGDFAASAKAFRLAYAATGNLRLRNHALAALDAQRGTAP